MDYFEALENRRFKCLLCSHYCKLKENQIGICGVNKNVGDRVKCLVYGYIDALHVDPVEKKPLYHFLPNTKSLSLGTVGCNFKCDFCQNHSLSQRHDFSKERNFSPKDIVAIALHHGCKSISFTYNEPTIFYPYAKDIALEAKKHGIKSVYVTNGFESGEVIEDMKGVIDALNVDLKTFNEKYYKSLGGGLDSILQNLINLVFNGLHVEITTLIVPTQNDSVDELQEIIDFIKNSLNCNVPWHISAFHPNYKRRELPPTSKEKLFQTYEMAKKSGLNYAYMGNIGTENPTICPTCKEILIQRQYFGVTKNSLKNGTCPKCSTKIKGVFS